MTSHAELQQAHGVSRGTAQRALDELARSGLVLRRRRLGTIVIDPKRQENLLRLADPQLATPVIRGRHVVRTASVVTVSDVPFDVSELEPDTPVILLGRQKLDESDAPIGMEWSVIPFALTPHLLDEDLVTLRLLPYFQRLGLPVENTRLYLDPVIVDEETGSLMGCAAGIPALRRRRYTWLEDGQLVEAGRYYTRPDLMELYVEQSVRSL